MPLSPDSTPRGPRATSRLRWRELVVQYEHSDLTQRDFCEQHQLALSSFARWRRRVLAEHADRPPAFVAVTVADDHSAEGARSALRVTLPGGLVVDGVTSANVAVIAALVRAL